MNADSNIQRLSQDGDPFEILICQESDELFQVLSPYAEVWAQHIFPRRLGDGSEIEKKWMSFGSSHYTALIRLYHAYCSKNELLSLCKQAPKQTRNLTASDYTLLLRIHASCSAFWENLGSTIDNFTHAWDDARRLFLCNAKKIGVDGDEEISFTTISRAKYPQLNYAYNRRTQFIHSKLVPKRFQDGMVVFNIRHYDNETTSWLPDIEVIEMVDEQIAKDWDAVIKELGVGWRKLSSWLQSRDTARPKRNSQNNSSVIPGEGNILGPSNSDLLFTTPPSASKQES
jgi:hypothetical protein